MRQHIKRKTPNLKKQPPLIVVVDIETDNIGGDFIHGAYAREDDREFVEFRSIGEWVTLMFDPRFDGVVWYAHNGGEYDYKYIIEGLQQRVGFDNGIEVSVISSGTRVIGFVIERPDGPKIELRDSWAIIPQSLKKVTEAFAPANLKGEIDFEHERFDPMRPEHIDYLRRDVFGLLDAVCSFREIIRTHYQTELGWTVPATSLRAWLRTLPEAEIFFRTRKSVEDFCREGYYGGYVFLTNTNENPDVVSLDVNSMYPAMMRKGVPVGPGAATREYYPDRPGIYLCRVRCPEGSMPIIPYRHPQGGVLWARGEFTTTITSLEVEYGRSLGYRIDIIRGYVFDGIRYLFDDYINLCESRRIEHKGTATEQAVKLMQNGLYGKFGSKPRIQRVIITQEPPKDAAPVIDATSGDEIDNVWTVEEELHAGYIAPHWAAWITANARITLHRTASLCGWSHVHYGDTDSLKIDRSAVESAITGGFLEIDPSRYGAFKWEETYDTFQAIGPKNYVYTIGDREGLRSKGIPKRVATAAEMRRSAAGEKITHSYTSTNGTLVVLKSGKAFAETRTRSYSQLRNSRGWYQETDGKVHATIIDPLATPQGNGRTALAGD